MWNKINARDQVQTMPSVLFSVSSYVGHHRQVRNLKSILKVERKATETLKLY